MAIQVISKDSSLSLQKTDGQENSFLIPTTLGDENPYKVLPSDILPLIRSISHFLVEDERTARRFIKKIDQDIIIDSLTFFEINKRTRHTELSDFLTRFGGEHDLGVISEAGCPGVADPALM